MRLKRLEIFGFKSFFDKTTLTFQHGITGIVGPNGCGKSNIADAILWVMGEQSPKSFRGERMEDVIFSGTEQRKALSVAEVSLTIGSIDGELPAPYTPYAELTFSRRLYRSGESDYLINKTPCRLKDIRDLLIDTGAGYRAHTIIGQGKVDTLVSATPMQRREIVEEAAGIAKYRLRKAEALRKLEATERNLTRVSDIISELKRQRNGLDRQARKAERFKTFSERLKDLECQVAFSEWQTWAEREAALAKEEGILKNEALAASTELSSLEQRQSALSFSITQKEVLLQKARRLVSEAETAMQGLEGKIETLRAESKGWQEVQARSHQEMGMTREGLAALLREKEALGQERHLLAQELPEKERRLAAEETRVKTLESTVRTESLALEKANARLFHLVSKGTTSQNNLRHFQSRLEALLRQKERLQRESERLSEKKAQSESALEQLKNAYKETSDQLLTAREAQLKASSQLEKLDTALVTNEKRRAQIKEDSRALDSEIASREEFYRGLLGKPEGAENALLSLEGLQGMVADLIDVPPAYERAIESVLEKRLNAIVVEDHEAIQKGLAHLRRAEMGRGIFFPRKARARFRKSDPVSGEGLIGPARELISPRAGDESIADALLGGVMIVKDLDAALGLWSSFPAVESWVTLSGEVLSGSGMVTGGDPRGDGLLEQKRDLQQRSESLHRLQQEKQTLESVIAQDQADKATLLKEKEASVGVIRALEVALLKIENDQSGRKGDLQRFEEEGETILFEQEECLEEEASLRQSDAAERKLIEETECLKKEQEAAIAQQKNALAQSREKLEHLSETVVHLRIETQSLKEKKRHLLEKTARLTSDAEKLQHQIEEKAALVQSLQKKLEFAEGEATRMRTSIEEMAQKREAGIAEIRAEQEAHAALLSEFQSLDTSATALRKQSEEIQKSLQEKALKKVEAKMSQQKILETIAEKYHIEISGYQASAKIDPEEVSKASESDAQAEDRQDQIDVLRLDSARLDAARIEAASLHQKIEEIGPVNLAAIEEYSTLDERYQFLSSQEADLTKSIEGLREVIAKINKTTRGLFVETFHQLNRKFGEVFTSFFGGGHAELVLLDPAQPLETGIEMLAQPPGKGKRNLMLFSGGEKALKAISLLFATFLIHPTPFCLLDEIDAPLDEENTRRFTEVLLEMSQQTQFIIVTHNKFTMEIADVLYGVTMEETGLSKLVSVNLKNTPPERSAEPQAAAASSTAETEASQKA